MRVLVVHERYQSNQPSGELGVFQDEVAVLRRAGHEVHTLVADNDAIAHMTPLGRAALAVAAIWNPAGHRAMRDALTAARPHVAHFHNTFPLLSPAAYDACHAAGVPVVQTLHNYRTICPAASLYRDGVICRDCVGGSTLPAIRHACYRGSRATSASAAAMVAWHRSAGTWSRKVELFIALTKTSYAELVRGGLPASRMAIKPNLMVDPPEPRFDDDGYVIYAGRLSEEKGVHVLLEAIRALPEIPFRIYGAGPLTELVAQAAATTPNLSFLGRRPQRECIEAMRGARLLLQASTWLEPCPMTVREAFACGTPVVATAIGGLTDMVEPDVNGLHCAPNDAKGLAAAVRRLMADDLLHGRLARGARATFERDYAPEPGLAALMACYERAIRSYGGPGPAATADR